MQLTNENYYLNNSLMSASQFKSFRSCEAKALAEFKGEYKRKPETALLVGSYVDSWFEGTLDEFKEQHPEVFLKTGGLKAEFKKAEECIKRASSDECFMQFMSGEKQKIVTGTIAGVEFKGKLDSYIPHEAIVDLKCMKNIEPIWNEKERRKVPFIEAWGYDIQLAIYQELVCQETGEKLKCYIAVVTKEDVPDIQIYEIDQQRLDECLKLVEENAPHYKKIKNDELEPVRCEKCDYCKMTKKLTGAIPYRTIPTPNVPSQSIAFKIPTIPTDDTNTIPNENAILKVKKSKKKKHKRKIVIKVK